MTKKSILARQKKREILYKKFEKKKTFLAIQLKKTFSFEEKFVIKKKLQKLPKNSSVTRLKNRCWKTGKARGYFRFFGLCRNSFRELALECFLPGIIKAS